MLADIRFRAFSPMAMRYAFIGKSRTFGVLVFFFFLVFRLRKNCVAQTDLIRETRVNLCDAAKSIDNKCLQDSLQTG